MAYDDIGRRRTVQRQYIIIYYVGQKFYLFYCLFV